MKQDELPPPETLIEYSDGACGALMFHYGVEGDRYDRIALNQGFETRFMRLDEDRDTGVLQREYEDGSHDVCARWFPTIPEGWLLGAKDDSEDGPYVCFIRKIAS
jgi:hypothetical protein